MNERLTTAAQPPLRATPRPGAARRLVSALRAGLYRPLAGDDDRVAYWVRHVRNGVLLTEAGGRVRRRLRAPDRAAPARTTR